jgi:hypothetical protein
MRAPGRTSFMKTMSCLGTIEKDRGRGVGRFCTRFCPCSGVCSLLKEIPYTPLRELPKFLVHPEPLVREYAIKRMKELGF